MQCLRYGQRASRRPAVTLTELLVAVSVVCTLVALSLVYFSYAQRAADKFDDQLALVSPQHRKAKTPVNQQQGPSPKVPNQYVVTFKRSVNPHKAAAQLARNVPATILHVYKHAFKGAAVRIQPGAGRLADGRERAAGRSGPVRLSVHRCDRRAANKVCDRAADPAVPALLPPRLLGQRHHHGGQRRGAQPARHDVDRPEHVAESGCGDRHRNRQHQPRVERDLQCRFRRSPTARTWWVTGPTFRGSSGRGAST